MTSTTDPTEDIRVAERRETEARERLTETLHELQAKLNPKALAREGARKMADAGQSAASKGADVARRNPAPIAGAAAVGVLFLARKRIAGLFRRKKKLTVPAQARSSEHSSPKDHAHD